MADLSLGHQFGERAHRVFDRRLRIDPVLVAQIDVVGVQPLRASPRPPRLTLAGLLSSVPRGRPLWEMKPNLVATTTSSRRPLMARPTISSLWKGPYASAVSMNVTPSSSARWMVRIDSASSGAAP